MRVILSLLILASTFSPHAFATSSPPQRSFQLLEWIVSDGKPDPLSPDTLSVKMDGASATALNITAAESNTWAIPKDLTISDGVVQTRFRLSSKTKRGTLGVIFRARKIDSYILFHIGSGRKGSFSIVKRGKRSLIKAADFKLRPGQWHELRIDFQGSWAVATLDDTETLEIESSQIKGLGSVGVWAEKGSRGSFKNFTYKVK